MALIPIDLAPGELWVHVGQTMEGCFPKGVEFIKELSAYAAKKSALDAQIPIVLITRMSQAGLHTAQRGDGVCDMRDIDSDLTTFADVVTTGFVGHGGLVIGCLKLRDGGPFRSFQLGTSSRTIWDYLTDG